MVGGMGVIRATARSSTSKAMVWLIAKRAGSWKSDAIYRIYSMSKPITGVALMMLYEEGKFRLNDPIAMYMPEFANLQVATSTAGTNIVSDGTTSRTVGAGDESLVGQWRNPHANPPFVTCAPYRGHDLRCIRQHEVDQLYRKAGLWVIRHWLITRGIGSTAVAI
ncbi:MAG: hypothetical protein CM15mP120_01200 [Pseudomonadota bacterium]|nr:MAG: hypothetical protein CM15mP120_01200 [Pseudomonadota bacterium]